MTCLLCTGLTSYLVFLTGLKQHDFQVPIEAPTFFDLLDSLESQSRSVKSDLDFPAEAE